MQLRQGQEERAAAGDPARRSETGRQVTGTPQEDDPPQVLLVVKAAENLAVIYRQPDRTRADLVHAIDALGRALLRLKKYLLYEEDR
jgi:hypothetical protein